MTRWTVWRTAVAYGATLALLAITSLSVRDDAKPGPAVEIQRRLGETRKSIEKLRESTSPEDIRIPELHAAIVELSEINDAVSKARTEADIRLSVAVIRRLAVFLMMLAACGFAALVVIALTGRSMTINGNRNVLWSFLRRRVAANLSYQLPAHPTRELAEKLLATMGESLWHLEQARKVLTGLEAQFKARPGMDAELLGLVIDRLISMLKLAHIQPVDPLAAARAQIENDVRSRLAQALEAEDLKSRDAAIALATVEASVAETRRQLAKDLLEVKKARNEFEAERDAATAALKEAEVLKTASQRESHKAAEDLRAQEAAVVQNAMLLAQIEACVDFNVEQILTKMLAEAPVRERILVTLRPFLELV